MGNFNPSSCIFFISISLFIILYFHLIEYLRGLFVTYSGSNAMTLLVAVSLTKIIPTTRVVGVRVAYLLAVLGSSSSRTNSISGFCSTSSSTSSSLTG